jgi:salicylate hydroxylase
MDVMRKMGLLDVVLRKAEETEVSFRCFQYISGYGNHELLLDVSWDLEGQLLKLRKYSSVWGKVKTCIRNRNIQVLPIILTIRDLIIIPRPAFLEGMEELLDESISHFNKRCTRVEGHQNGNTIYFSDGTSVETDLVIGADGIKSAVRSSILGGIQEGADNMVFTNTVAYRGLVPTETLKKAGVKTVLDDKPLCWVGQNRVSGLCALLCDVPKSFKHVITFPIRKGSYVSSIASWLVVETLISYM